MVPSEKWEDPKGRPRKEESDKENNCYSSEEDNLDNLYGEEANWQAGSRNRQRFEEQGESESPSPTSPVKEAFFDSTRKTEEPTV